MELLPLSPSRTMLVAVLFISTFLFPGRTASVSATAAHDIQPSQCPDESALPPPDEPFRVVWNQPDRCEGQGWHLNLTSYGIVANAGRVFIGDQIQTLYNTGPWPTYHGATPSNGGLPQLFNVTASLASTRAAMALNRRDNFTGLGVLDFETWRANFILNFGGMTVYKKESVNLVRSRHPDWNTATVNRVAAEEWEAGARKIMSSKLAVGQELMPGGYWGYYLYPRTWDGGSSPFQNDRMAWLWTQATGLYPSIYLTDPNKTEAAKSYRVAREMTEALRIQRKWSPPNTVIYPYSNLQQGPYLFFQEDHLRVTLGLPAKMGASGVVLWGSSSYYRARDECKLLHGHVHSVLGPYVKQLTSFMTRCSQQLCGANGRCVHNDHDTLVSADEALRRSAQCVAPDSLFADYHCRCYAAWHGDCCHDRRSSQCQPVSPSGPSLKPHVTQSHVKATPDLIGR